MKSPQKVLVYRVGSLGDTIIALPSFHRIRKSFPDAEITLLTNKPVASKAAALEAILGSEHSYFFDKIINYPDNIRNPLFLLSLLWKIRRAGIKTLVNITPARTDKPTKRDHIFFGLAGIRKFIGFPKLESDFIVEIDPATGEYEWEAKRLARRISELGPVDFKDGSFWDMKLTDDERQNAAVQLQGVDPQSPLIAIGIGTKAQPNDWGIDNWKALLSTLGKQYPHCTLVMVGAKDEFELAEECIKAWGNKGLNICGKTSPRESAVILEKAKLFIGHDSGPMHLAGCMGTPCVALYPARAPAGRWFPRGGREQNGIIYHNVDCARCGLLICIEQQKKCIMSITIDEVMSVAAPFLP